MVSPSVAQRMHVCIPGPLPNESCICSGSKLLQHSPNVALKSGITFSHAGDPIKQPSAKKKQYYLITLVK